MRTSVLDHKFQIFFLISIFIGVLSDDSIDCTTLRKGQFLCPDPSTDYIDHYTQSVKNCRKNGTATVKCIAAEGIICKDFNNNTFNGTIECDWTNGKHFDVALIFSIFFGMFGFDRFYLGYPALGCLKLFTLGFMFIGQLIDVILSK